MLTALGTQLPHRWIPFDLASILSRDRNGNLMPNPPLWRMIAEDPMLADTKIIAEAWMPPARTKSVLSGTCDGLSGMVGIETMCVVLARR